jgi:DNA-binding response OmpR family regulator
VAKRRLLIVDADARSVRVLEANLTKAGHEVATARDGDEALSTIEWWVPDLVLSETRLPTVDGYELARRLKEHPEWAFIPFAFLTRDRSVEDKIRGLRLGIEDYLTKPIFIGELVSRVNLLLARRPPQGSGPRSSSPSFPDLASATDATILDLLKSLEVSQKSGVVHVRGGGHDARIYVRQGRVVDAEAGRLRGEDAIYRTLIWEHTTFQVELSTIDRPDVISHSTPVVLVEAMRRVDEWARLCGQLPPLSTVLEVDRARLVDRAAAAAATGTATQTMPDQVETVLRLVDGVRSIAQIVADSPFDDVSTLAMLARCRAEKVVAPASERSDPPEVSGVHSSGPLTTPLSGLSATELLKSWPSNSRTRRAGS